MCKSKICPQCSMIIPAHVWECTTNGCHHIFDECIPSAHDAGGVATIGRTYPSGTDPADLVDPRAAKYFYHN